MSTGSPVSGVDTISSVSHGHGHGHGRRGHGHSRSNRWSHGPISHSVSSFDASTIANPLSQSVTASDISNGSPPSSHWHGHQHTHSHASSIHENGWVGVNHVDAFHTHTPKHSHTGSITGLTPDTPLVSADPEPTTVYESITGILAAFPWIVVSWYYQQYVHWESPVPVPGEDTSDDTWTIASSGTLDHTAQRAGFLAAATMVLLGCSQAAQLAQRGDSMPGMPKIGPTEIRSSFGKLCSIALPIYASLKIGGFLVAFALLLATATGLPTIISGSNSQPGNKAGILQKKLTVGVILAVVVFSFLGMNTTWDTEPVLGYSSLLLSVFVIRPPFSASVSAVSTSASGLGISVSGSSVDSKTASASASPVSPAEAVLTAATGLLLALATAITSRAISFQAIDFVYILLTAGAFAVSLTFLIPNNLRSPHKIGLAIGTGTAALLCAPPMRDGVYLTYISRGILAALSFPAARFDDKHLRLVTHSHSHHHHSHHGKDASRITNLIIRYSEPYPLLYSILKESDSRRIFYFMTYVFQPSLSNRLANCSQP
ncbi:putative zinc transporter msc2 [Aspergillus melleus]|uniref:putative zinc transporter msc2 n=1 Tax=Aspergillus melleus TaxID=138277 RepID=UPI001E8DB0C7|nr:putative zinc transporter msc2 [Aspergillus melleus]KAH8435159.1 putative zinc transporter msc2 [Aspergillus melleus]